MNRKWTAAAAVSGMVLTLSACGGGAGGTDSAGDYPSQDMEWTIAFGPGGGNDIMARTMVDMIASFRALEANQKAIQTIDDTLGQFAGQVGAVS